MLRKTLALCILALAPLASALELAGRASSPRPRTRASSRAHGPSGKITVPARGVVQINDVDTKSSLRINAPLPVYAYASIIDAGGDPIFVIGAKFEKPAPVTPQCANPIPLEPRRPEDAAPGYIVLLDDSVPAATFVAQHGITPIYLYQTFNAFYAELSPEKVAELRCDPAVAIIEQDVFGRADANGTIVR